MVVFDWLTAVGWAGIHRGFIPDGIWGIVGIVLLIGSAVYIIWSRTK